MTYRVVLTAAAKVDVDAAFCWLSARTSWGIKWFNGLADAVAGLAEMPTRWGLARESRHFDEEIRQMLYGRKPHVCRVLFVVRADVVYVLHMRHAARPALGRGDVILPS